MFAWVGAGEAVSLSNLPHQLALALGTTDFVGGLIATTILFLLFVIPILYFTRGKNAMLSMVVGILTESLSVGLGWLPVWVLIITSLIIGLMFASAARSWITGHIGDG